ncbi:MAG: hypothetical protein FWC46_10120 [Actinomycetia bacterium]|nr:hypothetical protein [Actinomycetes bacterium]
MQIRDVPDDIRDTLAARAAAEGRSLQSLLLSLVTSEARAHANAGMFDATAGLRVRLEGDTSPASVIRAGRERGFTADRDGTPA